MQIAIASITVAGWLIALILKFVYLISDDDSFEHFSDMIMWAVGGFGAGFAIVFLVHQYKDMHPEVEQPTKAEKCITFEGSNYCGPQRIETSKQTIVIDSSGQVTVFVK